MRPGGRRRAGNRRPARSRGRPDACDASRHGTPARLGLTTPRARCSVAVMAKVVLKAQDLDGYLTPADRKILDGVNETFQEAFTPFGVLSDDRRGTEHAAATARVISLY